MRSPETGLDVLQRMLLALLVFWVPHPLSLDRKPIKCASLRRGVGKAWESSCPWRCFPTSL